MAAGASVTALGIDGQIDVDALDDGGDDDDFGEREGRRQHGVGAVFGRLGHGRSSHNNSGVLAGVTGAGAATTAGGMAAHGGDGASSGLLSGGVNMTPSMPPPGGSRSQTELGGGAAASTALVSRGLGGGGGGMREKAAESEWLQSQKHSKKKTKVIALIIVIILIIAIVGGVTAGVLLSRKNNNNNSSNSNNKSDSPSGGSSSDDDPTSDGESNNDDPILGTNYGGDDDWKSYLDNPQLRKVFHGMDYTPLDALYPECIDRPPTQSQVNIDIAIMSQLTNKVRLYGTDCDQAELVLNAIKTTGVDMKVWLGIWLDGNATTNARSLVHMYDILDKYPIDLFEGVVVGNEVLFRQELTESELGTLLAEVRTNLTSLNINLPLSTSDLGSKWTSTLVSSVDVLMANVHPFFGGVTVEKAASWTIEFFETNNKILTDAMSPKKRAMISEVGWPTNGGKKQGSVAGITELNRFMKDFVCQQNEAGLEYYWFSAFDEPWKVKFNTAKEKWEDKWGLLDAKRRVKPGLEIPSC